MANFGEATADAVVQCLLAALDAGDAAGLATLLRPEAGFALEQDGALIDLSRDAWGVHARTRTGAAPVARNALPMVREPGVAAFKVDTRCPARTFTDRILLRHDGAAWRIASIHSY